MILVVAGDGKGLITYVYDNMLVFYFSRAPVSLKPALCFFYLLFPTLYSFFSYTQCVVVLINSIEAVIDAIDRDRDIESRNEIERVSESFHLTRSQFKRILSAFSIHISKYVTFRLVYSIGWIFGLSFFHSLFSSVVLVAQRRQCNVVRDNLTRFVVNKCVNSIRATSLKCIHLFSKRFVDGVA